MVIVANIFSTFRRHSASSFDSLLINLRFNSFNSVKLPGVEGVGVGSF